MNYSSVGQMNSDNIEINNHLLNNNQIDLKLNNKEGNVIKSSFERNDNANQVDIPNIPSNENNVNISDNPDWLDWEEIFDGISSNNNNDHNNDDNNDNNNDNNNDDNNDNNKDNNLIDNLVGFPSNSNTGNICKKRKIEEECDFPEWRNWEHILDGESSSNNNNNLIDNIPVFPSNSNSDNICKKRKIEEEYDFPEWENWEHILNGESSSSNNNNKKDLIDNFEGFRSVNGTFISVNETQRSSAYHLFVDIEQMLLNEMNTYKKRMSNLNKI